MTGIFTARKIYPNTANGFTRENTVMSGDRSKIPSAVTPIGRRIATVNGVGVRLTAGRGSTTSRGVGRLIITDAGFTTTVFGFGLRMEVENTAAVGGSPRSSFWQV